MFSPVLVKASRFKELPENVCLPAQIKRIKFAFYGDLKHTNTHLLVSCRLCDGVNSGTDVTDRKRNTSSLKEKHL